ncbi:hypothetical protein V4C85_24025 [Ralstonia solanacearum]|uniref:hypothetical protein n=1 Tax=Ralstonia solanacearum TaxID=305 RepID=UPI0011C03C8F|nr:hypothetical protein [Ralstonia solanacearum]
MNEKMLSLLQTRVGRTAVGASTARGMGPAGTIEAARKFLQTFDLASAKANTSSAYRRCLDAATDDLVAALPAEARHWGSARKFFNIFMRNCAYNRFLCEAYRLDTIEPWMEVPLDSHVAKGLKIEAARCGAVVPRWSTVIGLSPEVSDHWQAVAQSVAERQGIHRVHLDVVFWNGVQMQKKPA